MMQVDGVDVLDVREAAAFVGRTPETVRRWVWSGRVSAVRRGHRLLIARTELEQAVAGHQQDGMSLREWAAAIPRTASGTAATASALVLEDRADDHGR